jgi:hypothetical protein
MDQVVSRRPLTAEDRVRDHVSPRGIFGGQSCTGTSLSQSSLVYSVNIIPPCLNTYRTALQLMSTTFYRFIFLFDTSFKRHALLTSSYTAANDFDAKKTFQNKRMF